MTRNRKSDVLRGIEKTVERSTGRSIDEIRNEPISEMSSFREMKQKQRYAYDNGLILWNGEYISDTSYNLNS